MTSFKILLSCNNEVRIVFYLFSIALESDLYGLPLEWICTVILHVSRKLTLLSQVSLGKAPWREVLVGHIMGPSVKV